MRIGISLLLVGLIVNVVSAKELKYPAKDIPLELKENANAVVRLEKEEFQVHDAAGATKTQKVVITILNEKGRPYGVFYHSYFGKSSDLVSFKGAVYDAYGQEIAKLKKSDLEDRSSFDGFSIYSDSRYQYCQPEYSQYPYTVEYESTVKYTSMMFYPSWSPQWRDKVSVIKSQFDVLLPPKMDLRYKEINLSQPVTKTEGEETKMYRWHVQNLPALSKGELGELTDITPRVLTGPHKFTFGGYSGDMSSWENYGKWQQKLHEDLGEVSPETIAEVKSRVAGIADKKEVVRQVYKYLQENTRYVSIQLGIGGWQPFAPSVVEETGYGDCKALTYYTHAMLEGVGIESIYTKVNAGTPIRQIHTDFPSHQFNHIFLCVPIEQDTVWLECTSQTNPFGYLGTFTSDRPVLLVTKEGGKMVRTPAMTLEESQKITNAEVQISSDGSAEVNLDTVHKGYFWESMAHHLMPLSVDEKKKWLYNNLDLPTFTISDLSFNKSGDHTPQVNGQLKLNLRKAVSQSGKRMFLQPNMMNAVSSIPSEQDRKSDFILDFNKVWTDTITYHFPPEFHPEFIPASTELEEDFGKFHYQILDQAGSLKLIRRLELRKGRYDPEIYGRYRDFLKAVQKADKSKVVMKNTT